MAGFESSEEPLEPVLIVDDAVEESVFAEAEALLSRRTDFEGMMGLVDEGIISLGAALKFCAAEAAHYDNPSEFGKPALLDFCEVAG